MLSCIKTRCCYCQIQLLKHLTSSHLLDTFVYYKYQNNEKRYKPWNESQIQKSYTIASKYHQNGSGDTLSLLVKFQRKLSIAGIHQLTESSQLPSCIEQQSLTNCISITKILERGCWSKESAFEKFYKHDIIGKLNDDFVYAW